MTIPLSSPFTNGTEVDKGQLDQLVAAINATPLGFLGSNTSATPLTLAALTTDYAGNGPLVVTLSVGQRVRVVVQARYLLGSATAGRVGLQAAYNTGGTVAVGSATRLGTQFMIYNNSGTTGSNGSVSGYTSGTVLLAAGTYTFYALLDRLNGGDPGDTITPTYVSVEGIGPS